MKITTVALRDQRVSPKKARLVIDVVRNRPVVEALTILTNLNKKSARIVRSLVLSGVDACKARDYKAEEIFISEAICQEGKRLKRFMVSARGRSREYKKRMSHLKVTLSKIEKTEGKAKPKLKKEGKNGSKS